jgi:hypothetical protein
MASCTNTSLFDTRTLKLSFQIPMEGCFAGFSRDEKYVVSRWWLAGFPEPTRHPITLEGVLGRHRLRRSNVSGKSPESAGQSGPEQMIAIPAVSACDCAAPGTQGRSIP